ncbi:MAG TPA: copper chaperone PCu(A)C [Gammaproteobacteria bacterium]|nr:copper chaperone PCu(A)C [Gammaproteobacteria bacterium]
MKGLIRRSALLFAGLLAVAAVPAAAAEGLTAHHAWVREAPPGMRMLAGYVTLENKTDRAIKITGASSPAFGSVELHRSEVRNGVAHMIKQDHVTIPANGKFSFEPGGYHLMLMQPKHALKAGDSVKMTLRLNDGRTLSFKMPVRKAGAGEGGMHMHMNH